MQQTGRSRPHSEYPTDGTSRVGEQKDAQLKRHPSTPTSVKTSASAFSLDNFPTLEEFRRSPASNTLGEVKRSPASKRPRLKGEFSQTNANRVSSSHPNNGPSEVEKLQAEIGDLEAELAKLHLENEEVRKRTAEAEAVKAADAKKWEIQRKVLESIEGSQRERMEHLLVSSTLSSTPITY